jgi:hypothetical protein
MRSAYLAAERDIPKKRTITMETLSTNIGGCCAAIVISHALEIVSPRPPIRAAAPNDVAIAIRLL